MFFSPSEHKCMEVSIEVSSHIQPQTSTATVQDGTVDSEPSRPAKHTLPEFNPSPQKCMTHTSRYCVPAGYALNLMKQDNSLN